MLLSWSSLADEDFMLQQRPPCIEVPPRPCLADHGVGSAATSEAGDPLRGLDHSLHGEDRTQTGGGQLDHGDAMSRKEGRSNCNSCAESVEGFLHVDRCRGGLRSMLRTGVRLPLRIPPRKPCVSLRVLLVERPADLIEEKLLAAHNL
jgi:hypothetical protein